MLLSEYCNEVKDFIESTCEQIKSQGSVVCYFNGVEYTNCTDFLDDCVLYITEVIKTEAVERDIDIATALRESGVVQGYLDNTDILCRVIKDRNPLRGIFG